MFKELLTIFFAVACISECTFIRVHPISKYEVEAPKNPFLRTTEEKATQWRPHVMDFWKLIDVENMMTTAMQYMTDPEVITFFKFMFSSQFKEIIWDFETMEEFKEASAFLASKGYDVENVMNFINGVLNLPPFEKLMYVSRNGKGISGFFEAMFETLPLEDMKKLFENKLEANQEITELFEIINSDDFMDIMRRMHQNPKFTEIMMIFEGYGFDFDFLCKMAKEIFGDYYQGVFCE